MAVSIKNLKEYVSGEKAKQSAIKTAKDYISRFRDAESVFTELRDLCMSEKITHDPQRTTIIKFPSPSLECYVEVIFSNKTGLPVCATLINGDLK